MFRAWQQRRDPSLLSKSCCASTGKVAVVTGAANGIGRAIGLAGFDLEGTEVVGGQVRLVGGREGGARRPATAGEEGGLGLA
jgi:NAD(P)-dependent dehydrogenase (short-subunit alcohol dehydrogenase family)